MQLPNPADAFSRDHHLAAIFRELVIRHGILTIIETGTHYGASTVALAAMVPYVVTIEANPRFYAEAAYLDALTNVLRIHEDSPKVLAEILQAMNGTVLLFLDSHWHMPTPTPLELRAIAASGIKPAVIVIHDVQVPDHPELGFDSYPDFTYNWETIKPLIEAIYGPGGYTHCFNDKAAGAMRGALIVESM